MAYYTADAVPAYSEPSRTKLFFSKLMFVLTRQAGADARRARIEALEAKTDAELARMGLKREDIGYHVFRDLYYI